MMRALVVIAGVAGLGLASCDAAPPPENTTAPDPAVLGNVQQQVTDMAEPLRNGVLIRAILDAGLKCDGVVKSTAAPEVAPATWRAECKEGSRFLIQIGADGNARVTAPAGAKVTGE